MFQQKLMISACPKLWRSWQRCACLACFHLDGIIEAMLQLHATLKYFLGEDSLLAVACFICSPADTDTHTSGVLYWEHVAL